jgi:hypothetical protein
MANPCDPDLPKGPKGHLRNLMTAGTSDRPGIAIAQSGP